MNKLTVTDIYDIRFIIEELTSIDDYHQTIPDKELELKLRLLSFKMKKLYEKVKKEK